MSKTKNNCDVRSCFLCKACSHEWLELVAIHKKNILYKKGETIFKEGQPVEGIWFLYSGKAKVHKPWGEQKELIIRFAADGDVLGHRGIGSNHTYPVSATALEPTITCFIDTAFFVSSLKMNPELTYRLMMFYAQELQATEHRMRNLVQMDMKGRIADSLLSIQMQFGKDENGNINMLISRQDLASFAGATYETVFRVINELVHDKLVALSGKSISIANYDNLLKLTAQGA